ncbi:lysylphosphatidylglycerol synthase transmembrane domain-containing protein [Micromonospora vulcania]|uniref:YbhN family protein n=1 Tax=Micromonospora vulcania TaxID=1441873 RepID=A0ABW1HBX3_9ACTN
MLDHQPDLPASAGEPQRLTTPGSPATSETESRAGAGPAASIWKRPSVRLLLVAVVVGLAAIGLRGRLPAFQGVVNALAGADYRWVLLAALLQFASIGAFALQQRRLLHRLGVHLRRGHAFAITLASTALSISMPAGAAVATGFTIRKYQHASATREVAAATVVVSGLASIGGLALLYVGAGAVIVARNPTALLDWQPLIVVVGLAALTTAAVLAGRRYSRRPSQARGWGGRSVAGSRANHWVRTVLDSIRDAWRAGAELRVRDWAAALAFATAKWLADLLCLAAAVRALGLPIDVTTLAGIYLSVQIVRQVPLTPGGIGVIEAALVAGLTAIGASAISAAAAVLIYRLLSCWFIIPAGGIAGLMLRREQDASARPPSHVGAGANT